MTPRATRLLVLGLGNTLCGDDGLGVAAISELSRRVQPPPGVVLVDGGTLGLSLLPHLEDADDAILVDAIRDEAAPGTLVRLEGTQVRSAIEARLSVHQIGVADLFAAAELRGRLPRRLVLLGLVPATLEVGVGLSRAVASTLGVLVESVIAEASRMGHGLVESPRNPSLAAAARRSPLQ